MKSIHFEIKEILQLCLQARTGLGAEGGRVPHLGGRDCRHRGQDRRWKVLPHGGPVQVFSQNEGKNFILNCDIRL